MNKKKTIILLISFILLGIVLFIFMSKNNSDETNEQKLVIESLEECKNLDDEKAEHLSIEKSDIVYCDCIKDQDRKKNCKETSTDNNLYSNAIDQLDSILCENIKSTKIKKKCNYSVEKELKRVEDETLYLANKYLSTHDTTKAIELFEKLLEEHPNSVTYMLDLAQSYAEHGLKEQEQGRDQMPFVEKALGWVEKAEELEPKNPDVYRVKGYVYEIKPDPVMSVDFYDKSIELDSRFVAAYLGRAHAYNMMGVMDKALKDLEKASNIDLRNEHLTIYSQLCRMQSNRDDLVEEAIKNCKIVIEDTTTDAMFKSESYQILGGLYIKSGQLDNAESLLLEAKSMTPEDANLYVMFAELYIKRQEMELAEQAAIKCNELSPTKAACYEKWAYSVYQQEKFDDAIKIALEGLALVDDDVSLLKPNKNLMKKKLYYTLANIYYYKKDTENEMKYLGMGDELFK